MKRGFTTRGKSNGVPRAEDEGRKPRAEFLRKPLGARTRGEGRFWSGTEEHVGDGR